MDSVISEIIGVIPQYVIEPIRARFRIIRNVGDNVQELARTAAKLDGRSKAEQEKLQDTKKQDGVGASADAERWFSQADEVVSEANNLMAKYEEQQMRGACSNCFSFFSHYQLSKRALTLKKHVEDLCGEDPKAGWTTASTSQKGMKLNAISMEGQTTRETLKNEIIKDVLGDTYAVVGLHGMGGIGKTTLLKHVYNQFKNIEHFGFVIFTTVSASPNFEELRKQMAEGFGLKDCNCDNDVKQKLFRQTGKYLLILDDMWEPPVDLQEICIPAPTKENGCKITVASRSLRVITKFVVQFAKRDSFHAIPVNKLPPDEAWNLFVKKVGESLITSQPGIEPLAKEIVRKCNGLPLAIMVVGGTMSTRQSEGEWKDALQEMGQLSKGKLEDIEEKVFKLFNFSFDCLNPLEKSLFLYCCLSPEDAYIGRNDLYNFGIGEEALCDEMLTLEDMRNKVDVVVGNLQNSSMLEVAEYKGPVKVHDLLREFGLWLKSPKIIVKTAGRICTSGWSEATKISLFFVESLPDQLSDHCPHLHTFKLFAKWSNNMNIPQVHFLENMPALKILALYNCCGIKNLPPSISHLVNLSYLSLKRCHSLEELPPEVGMLVHLISLDLSSCEKLKGLPMEMKELKILRHLDISDTKRLKSIPCGLLSGLHKLEEIETKDSGLKLDSDNVLELCELIHLTCISHLKLCQVKLALLKPLAKCIISQLEMWNCEIDPSDFFNFLEASPRLDKGMSFIFCEGLTRVQTHDYISLTVISCQHLKTLVMVEEEKVDEGNNNIIAFHNLKSLELKDLDGLETICSQRIPPQQPPGPGSSSCLFSNLKHIAIERCHNLKVLFTSGVTPLLLKLHHLEVVECSQLECLMVVDDDDDLESIINAFPCKFDFYIVV